MRQRGVTHLDASSELTLLTGLVLTVADGVLSGTAGAVHASLEPAKAVSHGWRMTQHACVAGRAAGRFGSVSRLSAGISRAAPSGECGVWAPRLPAPPPACVRPCVLGCGALHRCGDAMHPLQT